MSITWTLGSNKVACNLRFVLIRWFKTRCPNFRNRSVCAKLLLNCYTVAVPPTSSPLHPPSSGIRIVPWTTKEVHETSHNHRKLPLLARTHRPWRRRHADRRAVYRDPGGLYASHNDQLARPRQLLTDTVRRLQVNKHWFCFWDKSAYLLKFLSLFIQ